MCFRCCLEFFPILFQFCPLHGRVLVFLGQLRATAITRPSQLAPYTSVGLAFFAHFLLVSQTAYRVGTRLMSRTIPARLAVSILILGILIQFDPLGNFHMARLGPWTFVVASLEGSREGTLQRERVGSGTCCERGEEPHFSFPGVTLPPALIRALGFPLPLLEATSAGFLLSRSSCIPLVTLSSIPGDLSKTVI